MFNHLYSLSFAVLSEQANAEDVTGEMLREALNRYLFCISDDELLVSCKFEDESYEQDRRGETIYRAHKIVEAAPPGQLLDVQMSDLVGEYDTPDDVPEWDAVEAISPMRHRNNGVAGVWEFLVNLSVIDDPDIQQELEGLHGLQALFGAAKSEGFQYILFHQGT